MPADDRLSVVVITHQRRDELLATLSRMSALPEQPPLLVVDNASTDGTAEAVRRSYPQVTLLEPGRNLGGVGRNLAVARVTTPYVAFCDDDTWWERGSLTAAADLLEAHPEVAVVTGRIVVEPAGTEDPVVVELRESPVPAPLGLPGPVLGSVLAGASMVRRSAFEEVGGFSERLWLGGEEELLSADLLARGWHLLFGGDLGVTVHHAPSRARDPHLRRRHGIRNTLWVTWLRRPWPVVLSRTVALLRRLPPDRISALGLLDAVRGLPWVLRERRVLPPHAEAVLASLEQSQRTSRARRYVS